MGLDPSPPPLHTAQALTIKIETQLGKYRACHKTKKEIGGIFWKLKKREMNTELVMKPKKEICI